MKGKRVFQQHSFKEKVFLFEGERADCGLQRRNCDKLGGGEERDCEVGAEETEEQEDWTNQDCLQRGGIVEFLQLLQKH